MKLDNGDNVDVVFSYTLESAKWLLKCWFISLYNFELFYL